MQRKACESGSSEISGVFKYFPDRSSTDGGSASLRLIEGNPAYSIKLSGLQDREIQKYLRDKEKATGTEKGFQLNNPYESSNKRFIGTIQVLFELEEACQGFCLDENNDDLICRGYLQSRVPNELLLPDIEL